MELYPLTFKLHFFSTVFNSPLKDKWLCVCMLLFQCNYLKTFRSILPVDYLEDEGEAFLLQVDRKMVKQYSTGDLFVCLFYTQRKKET